eukprot:TRINITY_DN18526_c0_g1_i1.p2 TRINITY_DN18526_c0_g1~~TRINITY_DN18526_c0_g1_i1.p2  ORF type:complete len:206 (-),score=10.93 TRINITY_DN18526_c0_g1_i1:280-897(-)
MAVGRSPSPSSSLAVVALTVALLSPLLVSPGVGQSSYDSEIQSLLQQLAGNDVVSTFTTRFTSLYLSGIFTLNQTATLLIPSDMAAFRWDSQWDSLTQAQKKLLLDSHVIKGRYNYTQLVAAAPGTTFNTFNPVHAVNKTLDYVNNPLVAFQPGTSDPAKLLKFPSPVEDFGVASTASFIAHTVGYIILPPSLNCTTAACLRVTF